ncbi:MAG: hydroxymethylpyrimidine/phosphomethylpyrimidine kinase [Actinomycetia bacterium]|nr:hydroxymethylpyrimidine/phosphomethylpyrimidine kinase [Actinomycetes bacterium]MCP4960975.1 hydroxymethylpyrimidine/phosphomethylpyrimidine kinase [Actinomycetes bacterium]
MSSPISLLVGGLDPTGTAGLAVDVAVVSSLGVHPAVVATVLTAQTTSSFDRADPVAVDLVATQLRSVLDDLAPASAKLAMLWSAELAAAVVACVGSRIERLVVDPVLVSGTGERILSKEIDAIYTQELVARSWFFTPNRAEAALLLGRPIDTDEQAASAADTFVEMGARSAVVTGGTADREEVVDVIAGEVGRGFSARPRLGVSPMRGTGDVLSSALAALGSLGYDPADAYEAARGVVVEAVARGVQNPRGKGRPSVGYAQA